MKNVRVFVSGAAGVIGHELIPMLHEAGAVVWAGDLKPRPSHWPAAVQYRQGDLNMLTKAEVEMFGPEVFIHLAATFERSTESYDFWHENFRHNVQLSNHLMTVLKDQKTLKRVVFASSYLIYDPNLYSFDAPQEHPYSLKETDPIQPRNLTGMAKLAHEIELRFLNDFKREQFTTVNVRIYRGYGRGSRCIVSRWIRALMNGETLTVYRKEGLFDYIYAADTAKGLLKLADSNVEGTINLGTGRSRRVSDVLDVLRSHFLDMKLVEGESDIPWEASQADITLYKKAIGWSPEYTLETAIPLMIEHERKGGYSVGKNSPGNLLISSLSKKIPLAQSAKKVAAKLSSSIKIIGADSSDFCLGAYFVDDFWKMPFLKNLPAADLLAYCQSHGITAIVPTRDGELAYYSQLRDQFKASGISVMVSSPEAVESCLDKLAFYEIYSKAGFPVIPTATDIQVFDNELFVVKERHGAGSLQLGLRLNKEAAMAHAQKLEHPIFQPFIEGEESSIDIYVNANGDAKGVVLRKREVVVNGESQVTTTFKDDALEEMCRKFAQGRGFYGHLVVQVLTDAKGNYHIIECNPRFGGASTLSVAAGLDTFYWFLLESVGEKLDDYPFTYDKSKRIRQVRFAQDKIETL